MKKPLLILILFALLLSNCSKNGEEIFFNLQIITFEGVNSSANAKFPIEVQHLCMAFEKPSKYLLKGIPAKIEFIRISDSNFYKKTILNFENNKDAGNLKYRNYIFKKIFDTARVGNDLTFNQNLTADVSYMLGKYFNGVKETDPAAFLFEESEIEKPIIYKHYSNLDSLVYEVHKTLFLKNKKNIYIIISPEGKLISAIKEKSLLNQEIIESKKTMNSNNLLFDSSVQSNPIERSKEKKLTTVKRNSDSAYFNSQKTKINKENYLTTRPYKSEPVKPNPPILRIALKTNTIEWTNMGKDFQYEIIVQNKKGEGDNFYFENKYINNFINIQELNIKDSRIYNLTLKAKSQNIQETKTISFNLIKNGSMIDPRCKSK